MSLKLKLMSLLINTYLVSLSHPFHNFNMFECILENQRFFKKFSKSIWKKWPFDEKILSTKSLQIHRKKIAAFFEIFPTNGFFKLIRQSFKAMSEDAFLSLLQLPSYSRNQLFLCSGQFFQVENIKNYREQEGVKSGMPESTMK